MDVRMFTVGQIQENTYIFRRDGSDRALIVEQGDFLRQAWETCLILVNCRPFTDFAP